MQIGICFCHCYFSEPVHSNKKAEKAQRKCLQPTFILTKFTEKSTQIPADDWFGHSGYLVLVIDNRKRR
jgi:hypothetical protein